MSGGLIVPNSGGGELIVPGRFRNEVDLAIARYQQVEAHLARHDDEAADRYMDEVLQIDGPRIHQAVLTMVAAARNMPPP